MELRVLNYFLTTATMGSITSAAARLHIGQPTLSRQLKELENELGQRLFDREPNGVVLTEAGERLRTYALEMINLSHKIEGEFAAMPTNPMGDLYCGGVEGMRFHRMGQLVKRVREAQPNIRYHYHAGSFPEVSALVDRGILDFGLVYQPGGLEKYHTMGLPDEETWVALMRSDHPLAGRDALTADDLATEPLLMYTQTMQMPHDSNDLALWFGERYSQLEVMGTSNLTYTNSIMAQEGIGVFITWESLAQIGPQDDMVMIPLDPPVHARVTLIWSKDRPLSPTAEYFLEVAQEHWGIH